MPIITREDRTRTRIDTAIQRRRSCSFARHFLKLKVDMGGCSTLPGCSWLAGGFIVNRESQSHLHYGGIVFKEKVWGVYLFSLWLSDTGRVIPLFVPLFLYCSEILLRRIAFKLHTESRNFKLAYAGKTVNLENCRQTNPTESFCELGMPCRVSGLPAPYIRSTGKINKNCLSF